MGSTSIDTALTRWLELYDGERVEWRPEPGSELRAVAVRCPDFREPRGNWPRILHHGRRTARAVVLVHGLTDSPRYLRAIALRFAERGAGVVLPLLPSHGRRDPAREMRHADHRAWRRTVEQAVEIATLLGEDVSIGGFSTGGALAVDHALRHPETIAGKVFLFSAALGLPWYARLMLATPALPRWGDRWNERRANRGIGGNPYKYSRRFLVGGREVYRLIRAVRRRAGDDGDPFGRFEHRDRIFVAHSECDMTIPHAAVLPLVRADDPQQHHIAAAGLRVRHEELVLDADAGHDRLWPDEPPPPRANPEFDEMMAKALAFWER